LTDKSDRARFNSATLAARNARERGPLIDRVLRDYPKLSRDVAERMLKEAGH
jgi:hypothetical protein